MSIDEQLWPTPTDRGRLSPEQVQVLLQPIPKSRVSQDDRGHSAVAIHDIEAHLNRIFGFDGWDKEVVLCDLIREKQGHDTQENKKGWYVIYRATVRLTVFNLQGVKSFIREEVATGDSQNQPNYADAHDSAMKNAVSFATKRCAKTIGDQFGLSLYGNGSTAPLVQKLVSGANWKELAELAGAES